MNATAVSLAAGLAGTVVAFTAFAMIDEARTVATCCPKGRGSARRIERLATLLASGGAIVASGALAALIVAALK